MNTLYSLEQFHKMNHSLFLLSICGDHYCVDEEYLGISDVVERLSLIDNHPTQETLFKVFCTNNSDTYEKIYLDERGNISLSIILKLKEL